MLSIICRLFFIAFILEPIKKQTGYEEKPHSLSTTYTSIQLYVYTIILLLCNVSLSLQ